MKPFKLFYVLVFTCCITVAGIAQESPAGATVDFENYADNIALIESYISAMNSSDAKKMNSLFTEDAIIVGLGGTRDTISKQQHLDRYLASFKTDKITVTEKVNLSVKVDDKAKVPAGEYAFSWGDVMSTNMKTKKSAVSSYHVVIAITNGKISYFEHFYDSMPFAMRDGATLVMPE